MSLSILKAKETLLATTLTSHQEALKKLEQAACEKETEIHGMLLDQEAEKTRLKDEMANLQKEIEKQKAEQEVSLDIASL